MLPARCFDICTVGSKLSTSRESPWLDPSEERLVADLLLGPAMVFNQSQNAPYEAERAKHVSESLLRRAGRWLLNK